jgi:hypothetical protein
MLKSLRYNELSSGPSTPHTVNITSLSTDRLDASAWGYNLGGHVSYFFSKHVGVGGGIRFSRGAVKDFASGIPGAEGGDLGILFPSGLGAMEDLRVGHTSLAVGVRLRY